MGLTGQAASAHPGRRRGLYRFDYQEKFVLREARSDGAGRRPNVAGRGRLYRTRLGAILAEREMSSALVVVFKVSRQHTAEVLLIEDDDVIEAFAPDRADDAFDIGVLPRRSRRGDDRLDGQRLSMPMTV